MLSRLCVCVTVNRVSMGCAVGGAVLFCYDCRVRACGLRATKKFEERERNGGRTVHAAFNRGR